MSVAGFVFIVGLFGLYILSVGLPLWVAWRTRHGDGKIMGICVRRWVGFLAVIAAVCAVFLLVTQLPGLLADHDPQAPVGFFFFGLVVCALFPLFLLVGRGILAVHRILHGHWVNSFGMPEIIWLLISMGICVVVCVGVALHWYNAHLITEVSNPDASPALLRAIYAKTHYPWIDYRVQIKIAEHRRIPQDVINLIADSGGFGVRSRIVRNPAADAKVLEKLANDKDFWVRVSVALRDDCPDKLLEKLSSDSQDVVRRTVFEQIKKRKEKNENSKSVLQ